MKPATLVKSVASLALAVTIGFSQTAVTPVAKIAKQAAATHTPLPIMPAGTIPAGSFRSHAWIAGPLSAPAPAAKTLPAFCNITIPGLGHINCPNALRTAYGVPSIIGGNGGAGMTIAIVDAYHYAGAEYDLNYFSSVMNLPLCSSASGCFTQVNQDGGAPRATSNSNWEGETMLDIEWAHAMAPNAKILLVEGDDNTFDSLLTALLYAVPRADIVSNSYGASEVDGETGVDFVFSAAKPILFSSGDNGAPTQYPCASPGVTCVGGTTLNVNPTTFQRVSETGWAGSGGGCSLYEPTPAFQAGIATTCATNARATPDVAAIADPATGVAVLDSGNGGWFLVGGTSLACPVTAALYASVMTARLSFGKAKFGNMNQSLYNAFVSNPSWFYYDVTLGNNGLPAGPGYDLVTGMGVSKAASMANRFFGLLDAAPAPPLD